MAPSDNYFTWMDEQLKAEYRAFGGEPCKVCGDEIPGTAHWKQRDRHVCSSECNSKLIRRFKAKVNRGELPGYEPTKAYADRNKSELNRQPQTFRTDPIAEFPFEHGRFPIVGDIIERNGITKSLSPVL